MAGTIYHLAKELLGTVDQLIITDGEAGFRLFFVCRALLRLEISGRSRWARELPRVRREEAHRSAHVLGVEHQWFLNEKDDHFTLDAYEVLENSWNRKRVLESILERLRQGHYDSLSTFLKSDSSDYRKLEIRLSGLRVNRDLILRLGATDPTKSHVLTLNACAL
jgi:N-acetylglucosamine malate deacetylase 2